MITGKNLIALGYEPNRLFGKALEHINKYNLSEKDIHDFLKEFFKPNEVIEPFEKPVDYNRRTQSHFECVRCGHTENADLQASKNILELGHQLMEANVDH